MQDWPCASWVEQLAPELPGLHAQVLPEVDSSNSELMRRARNGDLRPQLLVALAQSAGRGRMGRSWLSQPADALTFSLGLPLHLNDWSGLSLAVGLAVANSLHSDVQLKWPNDLWVAGRKLGGILIETVAVADVRYAVIGIGLNIRMPVEQDLRTPAASLRELLPEANAAQALERVTLPLVQTVLRFASEGFAPLRNAYDARDLLFGRDVVCTDGTEGVARGVDESGALVLQTAQGLKKINSAEVSVRPLSPFIEGH